MKKASVVFVALILALCLVPSVGMLAFGPAGAGANEVLSPLPSLRGEDGEVNIAYLSQLADYVSDHFFLRQELITAGRKLETAAFRSSGEEDVVLGRDGWLFYASTVEDYTGTDPMTDRELYAAAKNLSLMAEACESAGVEFLFTVAPNKNSLYGEYMPDLGAAARERDAQRLQVLLEEMEVPYLDLFSLFASQDVVLYFAHDSHWTSRGAALAADAANAALGLESDYFSGSFVPSPHTGDLYEMLYPAAMDPETDEVCSPAIQLEYEGGGTRPDSVTINALGSGERRMLVYRDSFGNSWYPYLADSSARARFSRSAVYDLSGLEELDCVLVELVERNLENLVDDLPVLPAPEREAEAARRAENTLAVGVEDAGRPEGYVLLRGQLPQGVDPAAPVYVVCGGRTFEALLDREGFAAYVPAGLEPEQVLVYAGGVLVSCGAVRA